MEQIIYTKGYEELRDELKTELSKSVESFVRIGYLLKVARDTDVLAESHYSNMEEFALAEFNIDKGTASKFMAINDRFSENGYSDCLKGEYAGIGWSKLSIMLQLPDSINEQITPVFSKSEIQALRDEVAEEQKVTPMEHMLEGETEVTRQVEDMLSKAVRQLGESEPEMYREIHKAVHAGYSYDLNEIKSIMAPSGENMYSIRIRGVGRILLSLKDSQETVALVNERTGEEEKKLWDDVARSWLQIIDIDQTPEENWETVYGQPFPQEPKEEVAPVQPKKDAKKVKKVNESLKSASKEHKNVSKEPETVAEQQTLNDINKDISEVREPEEQAGESEEQSVPAAGMEEQLPGQMSVEDIPGVVPNKAKMPHSEYEKRKAMYLTEYEKSITNADERKNNGNWALAKTELEYAIHYLELLIELDDKVEDEEE